MATCSGSKAPVRTSPRNGTAQPHASRTMLLQLGCPLGDFRFAAAGDAGCAWSMSGVAGLAKSASRIQVAARSINTALLAGLVIRRAQMRSCRALLRQCSAFISSAPFRQSCQQPNEKRPRKVPAVLLLFAVQATRLVYFQTQALSPGFINRPCPHRNSAPLSLVAILTALGPGRSAGRAGSSPAEDLKNPNNPGVIYNHLATLSGWE